MNRSTERTAIATAVLSVVLACAAPSVPRREPLGAFTRDGEVQVHYGFPGSWRWQVAYRSPTSFRLTVFTTGAPNHYVFDGSALQSWVGTTQVSRDTRDPAAYESIGRWLDVGSLGTHGDGEAIELAFDAAGHIVGARGPIDVPGIGAGRLVARFSDFRARAGRQIPFTASYRLNGEPFIDERVTRFVPGVAVIDPTDPALATGAAGS